MWKLATVGAFKLQLQQDLKNAMKSKLKPQAILVKSLINQVQMMEKNQQEINVYELLNQQLKKREISIKEFEKAGRNDLVLVERAEAEDIQKYLPPALETNDLQVALDQIIKEKELKKRDFKLIFSELDKLGIYAPKQQIVQTVSKLIN